MALYFNMFLFYDWPFPHVYFAENVAYFHFNSWLSFQRLCRFLWGYRLGLQHSAAGKSVGLVIALLTQTIDCRLHQSVQSYVTDVTEWNERGKFRQSLYRCSRTRLRPRTTSVYAARFDRRRNGDNDDVHSLGSCSSDQSRVSTRTSSRRDRLCHRQTETTDLGRPDYVSVDNNIQY